MLTRDDIIRMAREAEMGFDLSHPLFLSELGRFAALVAEAEREACAQVCEAQQVGRSSYFEIDERIRECAEAIRARGDK